MGKRSQSRPIRRQENNIGCMSGFIRMFYFRHDAKFLLDRNQGSRRHTFSGFTGRGHSRKKSRDFEEIDEDGDNMDKCSSRKPTIKRLMEDELGKVKQLKIPNDEVQRILADLGHGVCLDQSSTQDSKSKGDQNHNTSVTVASPSRSLDPSCSNSMKEAEENELELALADFLGQIHRYHDEWPHKNCKNKSELCTEMKFLIQKKLNELNDPPCSLAYEQTLQSGEKEIAHGKHICSSRESQPKKIRDALEMLSSDTELFLKILHKPNSHILENIQRHQNRQIGTKLESAKTPGNTDSIEDTKSPNQQELATKTHDKESTHIFFWKKERSNTGHTAEGNNSSQPVNKIVILKPNPRRGIDPTVATSSTQTPELNATENLFSIKEIKRRFRIVTSEARKERPLVYEDNLQKDQHWLKSSAFTIRKDTRQLAEQNSEEKASSTAKKGFRPSTNSRQKQRNDGPGEINSNIITSSKDEFIFYDEAKKHLTNILKDKSQTTKYPTLQISRSSLIRMLSLPQCSTSSPRSNKCSTPSPGSSPRAKDRMDLSPEEANICAIYKAKREEFAKEESQSGEISVSVACGTSEALHEQAVQEWQCIKEESQETTQDGAELDTVRTEEIDKLDCSEKISNSWCIPEEQCRYNPSLNNVEGAEPGKKHVGMFPSSLENVVEKSECQEPATPRSSASVELISQFSLEGSHEKQEQPSPVSVLDPFFNEDVDNPDSEDMIKCELHADILRPQYTVDDGSDQGISWEDKGVRLGYIKALLELSELCTYQNLEVWYLEDELISTCLFEELHQGNQIDDTKLLFDCICEAVTEIQSTYFRSHPCLSSLKHNIRAPPMGQNLISEINKHVERHLHNQFPSTLDQLVNMDLEDGSWMDLRSESEEITVVLWDFILYELLEEVVYDLCI
ncbi:uncharacterized protein LOC133917134 [Phragmites australis]|uniref:uncharacterized protein LOC133917134 n=1 Tax=Phragmites australis TaxID=29695 RepID=UPI002D773E08|nr:uncharacterized protein LOC133917134 [Phragmites australis]